MTYIENLQTRVLSASLGMSGLDLSPVEVLALACYLGHTAEMLNVEDRRETYTIINNEVRAEMDRHTNLWARVLEIEED